MSYNFNWNIIEECRENRHKESKQRAREKHKLYLKDYYKRVLKQKRLDRKLRGNTND